jgi:hypothetical protein
MTSLGYKNALESHIETRPTTPMPRMSGQFTLGSQIRVALHGNIFRLGYTTLQASFIYRQIPSTPRKVIRTSRRTRNSRR